MQSVRTRLLLFATCLLSLVSQSSAQDAAKRMDNAIKALQKSGNVEPRTIQLMKASAAQAYLEAKDYKTALQRALESIQIAAKENLLEGLGLPLQIAVNVIKQANSDKASKKFLSELLHEIGDDFRIRQKVLDVLGAELMRSGDLVISMTVLHERWLLVRKMKPGTEEEFWACHALIESLLSGKVFDLAGEVIRHAEKIATELKRPDLVSAIEYQRAMAFFSIKEFELAIKIFLKQLEAINADKNQVAKTTTIQLLISCYMGLGKVDEASALAKIAYSTSADDGTKGLISSKLSALIAMDIYSPAAQKIDIKKVEKAIMYCQRAIKEKSANLAATVKGVKEQVVFNDKLMLASLLLVAGDSAGANVALLDAKKGLRAMRESYRDSIKKGVSTVEKMNVDLSFAAAAVSDLEIQVLIEQKKYGDALLVAESQKGFSQETMMLKKLGVKPHRQPSTTSLKAMVELAKRQNATIVFYSLVHDFDESFRNLLPARHWLNQPFAVYTWVIRPNGNIDFRGAPLRGNLSAIVRATRESIRAQTQPNPQKKTSPAKKPAPENAVDKNGPNQTKAAPKSKENKKPATSQKNSPVQSEKRTDANQQEKSPRANPDFLRILGEVLYDPIQRLLPKDPDHAVYFVPDGALFQVPFAALKNQKGQPILDFHTISVAPSIDSILISESQLVRNQKRNLKGFVLVGNPSMPSMPYRPDKPPSKLSPLRGAEREALYLAKVLNRTALVGPDATEEIVTKQMVEARFIHFATHGVLNTGNVIEQAYLSSVALAPSKTEDGFLTVREIMDLDLHADMVVLSACDTGRGQSAGDGLIGLTRGFAVAGVPSVVASLWPVSDHSAVFLMANFYKALLDGKSKSQALRHAMIETRKKFPLAKDWAAFSIYGSAN